MSLERLPWAKGLLNDTRTGTVETNKAMGAVVGFMGNKETQPDANQRTKENAEREEDEDVVILPLLESEDMSPIAMVEKFGAEPM